MNELRSILDAIEGEPDHPFLRALIEVRNVLDGDREALRALIRKLSTMERLSRTYLSANDPNLYGAYRAQLDAIL